jgi:hypothetical protein
MTLTEPPRATTPVSPPEARLAEALSDPNPNRTSDDPITPPTDFAVPPFTTPQPLPLTMRGLQQLINQEVEKVKTSLVQENTVAPANSLIPTPPPVRHMPATSRANASPPQSDMGEAFHKNELAYLPR